MRRSLRPAIVICLAMVLIVGLVSGMTALVCALVVPTWIFAALVVAAHSSRVPDVARPIGAAPVRSSAGFRGPPHVVAS
jgi:hypothetical protein